MERCRTCDLVERRDRGEAPSWDAIVRTTHWDVVHCYGTSLEGWLVLVVRSHRSSIAQLTEEEASALGPLLHRASRALHEVVGCVKTYAVQFAEHPEHPHVHVHVIPRSSDHPEDEKGPGVFTRLGVPDDEQVPESRMDELAEAIRAWWFRDGGSS